MTHIIAEQLVNLQKEVIYHKESSEGRLTCGLMTMARRHSIAPAVWLAMSCFM
jgi:hypothetical protein